MQYSVTDLDSFPLNKFDIINYKTVHVDIFCERCSVKGRLQRAICLASCAARMMLCCFTLTTDSMLYPVGTREENADGQPGLALKNQPTSATHP